MSTDYLYSPEHTRAFLIDTVYDLCPGEVPMKHDPGNGGTERDVLVQYKGAWHRVHDNGSMFDHFHEGGRNHYVTFWSEGENMPTPMEYGYPNGCNLTLVQVHE